MQPSIGVQAGMAVYLLRLESFSGSTCSTTALSSRSGKEQAVGYRRLSSRKNLQWRDGLAHGEETHLTLLATARKQASVCFICFLGYGGPYHPIGLDFWACSYSPTTTQHRRCSLEARLLLHMLRHADRGDAAEAWQPMSSEYKNRLKRSVRLNLCFGFHPHPFHRPCTRMALCFWR